MFKKTEKLSSNIDFLIVCLGNPGKQYEITRHNAGFLCADVMAQEMKFKIDRIKFKSILAQIDIDGAKCIVMKPQTFMNNSGEAVAQCASFYKIPVENIIVIFDDISLPVGKMRIRQKGSDGGHNGIKSIIYHLQSNTFPRVKIGVGEKPHPDYDLAAWVLSKFTTDEQKLLLPILQDSAEAVRLIVRGGISLAMNKFNS